MSVRCYIATNEFSAAHGRTCRRGLPIACKPFGRSAPVGQRSKIALTMAQTSGAGSAAALQLHTVFMLHLSGMRHS